MVKIFVVYDSKSESYGQPFFQQATGAAIRGFSDEANGKRAESAIAAHPEDYTLFEIGSYDHSDGTMKLLDAKVSRGCAIDYVRSELKAV